MNGVEYLYKALEKTPEADSARIHIALGGKLSNEAGMTHLEKALAIDPKNAEVHIKIANRSEGEKSIQHFKNAAEIEPENMNYQTKFAHSLNNNKRYEEALPIYQKVVDKLPDNALANKNIAENYDSLAMQADYGSDIRKEYANKAVGYFEASNKLEESSNCLKSIANCHKWYLNDDVKAIEYFKKAAELEEKTLKNIKNPSVYKYQDVADLFADSKDNTKAARYYDKAIELSTKDQDLVKNRCQNNLEYVIKNFHESKPTDKVLIDEMNELAKKHNINLNS